MTEPQYLSAVPKAGLGPGLGLRAIARLHAIDRRLQTVVLARFFGRWLGIPLFILTAALFVYILLIRGTVAASAVLLPILGSMVSFTIFWSAASRLRAEEEHLRRERCELATGTVSGSRFLSEELE